MKKFAFGAIALLVSAGATFGQSTIAYWNFNDSTPGSSGGLGTLNTFNGVGFPADFGDGLLTTNIAINTVAGIPSQNDGTLGTFAGSTLNALFGDVSGGALSIQAGVGTVNNGNWIQFTVDASLWTDLTISWAGRGTSTGFGAPDAPNEIFVSTDGANFFSIDTYLSRQTNFELYSFAAGSALDGAAEATFRIVFDGATGSTGNNRLDNVQINGNFIPTPGAIALFAAAGLAAVRRRRA